MEKSNKLVFESPEQIKDYLTATIKSPLTTRANSS